MEKAEVDKSPGDEQTNTVPVFSVICQYCGAVFVNVESLTRHHVSQHQSNTRPDVLAWPVTHPCSKCAMVFINQENLKKHLNSMHLKQTPSSNQGDFFCHNCSMSFVSPSDLQLHVQQDHKNGEVARNHMTNGNHANHILDNDSSAIGENGLTNQISILLNKLKQEGSEIYCPCCGVKTPNFTNLQMHLSTFHSLNDDMKEVKNENGFEYESGDNMDLPEEDYNVPKVECSLEQDNDQEQIKVEPGSTEENEDLSLRKQLRNYKKKVKYNESDSDWNEEIDEDEIPLKNSRKRKPKVEEGCESKCDYCTESFGKPDLLRQHVLSSHENETQDLRCEHCNKSFLSPNLLEIHMKNHSKQAEPGHLQCEFCLSKFKSTNSLRRHMSVFHPDQVKVYKCKDCDYTTIKEDLLTKHIGNKHDQKKFGIDGNTCLTCNKTLKSRRQALKHVKNVHNRRGAICPVCGKVFKEHLLKVHLRTVHNENIKQCFFCDFKSNTLHEHMKEMHPVKKSSFPCGACTLEFEDSDALESHHKQSHSETENCRICQIPVPVKNMAGHISAAHDEGFKERCEFCDFFSTLGLLYKHMQDEHLKDDVRLKVYCPHCKVKLLYSKISTHLQFAHPEKFEKFVCDDCGKTFDLKSSLKRHKSDAHARTGYKKCEICSKEVPSRRMGHHLSLYHDIGIMKKCKNCEFKGTLGQLKKHTAENHNEKVACHICHDVFKASVIRQHVRAAHVLGRVKCDYCELSFRTRWGKDVHVRNIHEREKHAQKCPHCDFKSVYENRLKIHIDLHAGIKPFSCDYCDYKVAWKRNLDRHIKKHHGINKS